MSATETSVAVVATAAGLAAIVIDYTSEDAAAAGPGVAGLAGAVTIGVAVLVFGGAVPRAARARKAARAGLVTSAIGFLSVASAWTGLPFVLGTGGAMLGSAARRDAVEQQRGLAAFAIGVGVLAVVLGAVAVVVR